MKTKLVTCRFICIVAKPCNQLVPRSIGRVGINSKPLYKGLVLA